MVRILADSTCDLSEELLQKYHVTVVPLHIVLGDREYKDGVEITPEEIYRWSDENKTTPKTSAASPEEAMQALEQATKDGDEVIVFTISGQMSTTVNVFRMAAEELGIAERASIVDSENLSTGIGLLVIEAAIMAMEGQSRQAIVERVERLRPLVRASFVVDTLTYLHRGGRCSSVAMLAGSMLKLHPKIIVKNGAMLADKKYRGKLAAAIQGYVKDMEGEWPSARADRVFITHSGCEQALVDAVHARLEESGCFREILVTRAGGVISSHCGPGTLGVLFIASDGQGDA